GRGLIGVVSLLGRVPLAGRGGRIVHVVIFDRELAVASLALILLEPLIDRIDDRIALPLGGAGARQRGDDLNRARSAPATTCRSRSRRRCSSRAASRRGRSRSSGSAAARGATARRQHAGEDGDQQKKAYTPFHRASTPYT